MNRMSRLAQALPVMLLLGLSVPAYSADPDSATVYEIQQGVYSAFTFVTCDSVVVTGVGFDGFFVAEQGGGPYNGIWVNQSIVPAVQRGDLVTVGGFYFEDSNNSIISASSGAGGFVTLQTQLASIPIADPVNVGEINSGSGTAEQWEGCLVTLDSTTSTGLIGGGEWTAIELDGEAPGETLIVDTLLGTYDFPGVGDTVVTLTGIMFYSGTDFKLEPRDNLDVLVSDAIPPSTITDLLATTGTYGGEIDLDWTSPGDDDTVGTALTYTIRYNTVAINDGNWGASNDVTGEPPPGAFGTPQSKTVPNLTPGQTYFFAMRSTDEFGNVSALSNSPSAIASTNPEFAFQVVFGNLHSHSALSDGTGTLNTAYTHARDTANIDVLSVTDHSHYLTTSEYNSILSTAAAFTETGVFVALAGQEMGIANSSGYGHMSVWNASQVAPSSAFTNLTNAYNFLVSEGVPGGFNHPEPMNGGSNFNNLAYVFQYDHNINTIEVRNGKRSTNYQSRYLQALANGWHIGAVANQDNHNGLWGDQPNPNAGNDIYLTGMLVDSLAVDGVLDAIWNRRTYATEINPPSDRVILRYKAGGVGGSTVWMGAIDTVSTTEIAFDVEGSASTGFQTLQLWRNGLIVKSDLLGSVSSFNWTYTDTVPTDNTNYYYFVKIIQNDQDATWSSPIWFNVNTSIATDVAGGSVPRKLELHQNRPNPFNPTTMIRFEIPSKAKTRLEIYDVSGRLVRTLVDGEIAAGTHEATWDGTDNVGHNVSSGVYFYRVLAAGKTENRKMLLLR